MDAYHIVVQVREWSIFVCDWLILYWIIKEYFYDKSKDEKKTVRVRRNKRGGLEVTEQARGVDVVIEGERK